MENNYRGNRRKKDYKKNGNFYIYTLLGAIVLCVLVGFVAYEATTSGKVNNTTKETQTTNEDYELPDFIKPEDLVSSTGLIEKIDSNTIFIYDIIEDKRYKLDVDSTTVIMDKYSKPLILAELTTGDIIDFSFTEKDVVLTEVKKNTRAWEHSRVNIQFHDTIEKVFTVDSKDYKYNDNTIIEYIRGDYPFENITTHDTITVSGYGENIYYIKIIKGHGTIDFIPNEEIVGGTIELDTTDIITIEELVPIVVSEGAHKIVVKGSNINPYTEDIYVEANGTSTVDLTKIVTKKGIFLPNVNVSEYTISINDVVASRDEPIILDYGVHSVKVESEGYVGFEGTVNIKAPETQMKIQLEERILMKKMAITSNPTGAEIYLDNVLVGTTPLTKEIEFGVHTVSAKLEGYIDLSIPVEIGEDTKPGIDFTFTKSENIIPTEVTETEEVQPSEGTGSSLFGD